MPVADLHQLVDLLPSQMYAAGKRHLCLWLPEGHALQMVGWCLERIAELMGKQQREPQEAIESEAQAKKLLESLGYDIF